MGYVSSPFVEVTYHIGPAKNRFCKVKTRNHEFNYNIDGIKKGKRFTPKQRRELIHQIIAKNNIRHTHIILLAKELGKIAKKTTEKVLLELENAYLIESDQKGTSSNSVKIWMIKPPETNAEKGAKKHVENIVKSVEKYVSRIERIYPKLNDSQKAWSMMYLFQAIHNFQPLIEVINQEYNIRQNKRRFDGLVTRAYKILENEKRDYFDGRPTLRRLLDLQSSQPMVEMNNFLEEIKKS